LISTFVDRTHGDLKSEYRNPKNFEDQLTKKYNPLIIQLFLSFKRLHFRIVSSFGFRASGFSPTHNICAVPEITYCDYLQDATLEVQRCLMGSMQAERQPVLTSFGFFMGVERIVSVSRSSDIAVEVAFAFGQKPDGAAGSEFTINIGTAACQAVFAHVDIVLHARIAGFFFRMIHTKRHRQEILSQFYC
jgi:hypothetical protein